MLCCFANIKLLKSPKALLPSIYSSRKNTTISSILQTDSHDTLTVVLQCNRTSLTRNLGIYGNFCLFWAELLPDDLLKTRCSIKVSLGLIRK